MKLHKGHCTLILFILTVIAVFMTFSCSGLFTTRNTNRGTGTLTIALPGSGARDAYTQEDVDFYKVSIISEKTGEVVVPTQTADAASFTAELPVGDYSVIVQGIDDEFRWYVIMNAPLFIGRTNNVAITNAETTTALVKMIFFYDFDALRDSDNGIISNPNFDWGSGKLPAMIKDGHEFKGWYTDNEFTQKITDFPSTEKAGEEEFIFPVYMMQRKSNFYASSTGEGDGYTTDDPMKINDAFFALLSYSQESDKIPTLYLLDDVTLPDTEISCSVNIIGAGGDSRTEKVTIHGSGNSVASFAYGGTYSVKNVIVDGQDSRQGIHNEGNLTLDKCEIINCHCPDTSDGGGIYSSGSLNIQNSHIDSCLSDSYGGGIFSGIENADLRINNCEITSCTAEMDGGGIFIQKGTMILNTTTITDCMADESDNSIGADSEASASINGYTMDYGPFWVNEDVIIGSEVIFMQP